MSVRDDNDFFQFEIELINTCNKSLIGYYKLVIQPRIEKMLQDQKRLESDRKFFSTILEENSGLQKRVEQVQCEYDLLEKAYELEISHEC